MIMKFSQFGSLLGLHHLKLSALLKNPTKKKIKIGHCGTLDPFAEGVIVICLDLKPR